MASTYGTPTAQQRSRLEPERYGYEQPTGFFESVRNIHMVLRIAFVVLPIAAGLDKFFHILANWDEYLAPVIAQNLPVSTHTFMLAVGVIEIVAGLLVAFRPDIFGYLVMVWLWAIAANLLLSGEYFDIAVRDVALSLGALTVARLGQVLRRHESGMMAPTTTSQAVHEYAEAPR